MSTYIDLNAEWLEPDGLGGFASGTVSGRRTRRYHAVLLVAASPPTGRVVLVGGFDAWLETPRGTYLLSTQQYGPHPQPTEGPSRIVAFRHEPWPTWEFHVDGQNFLAQEIFVPRGYPAVALSWRLNGPATGMRLHLKPFLAGRDYHALHHENGAIRTATDRAEGGVRWRPYGDLPPVTAASTGTFDADPVWYRGFYYEREHERGLDCREDLLCPGEFHFDLSNGPAVLILQAGEPATGVLADSEHVTESWEGLVSSERQRREIFPTPEDRGAEAYLVRSKRGGTVVAGYPWFTDWGRDTFIALRGLCLARGRLDVAREIVVSWADHVSEGMLPNRFPDRGDVPEYNSVDASLWYVVAVHDYLQAAGSNVATADRDRLREAVEAILSGYLGGTRYGIHARPDGLIAAGEPGVQLTWMDAKVGDWVVTPRIGKPVEVQALWINALWIASTWNARWRAAFQRARRSFTNRFWNAKRDCLFDVVDVDHQPGCVDESIRPNQILAVGGLPLALLKGHRASSVVDVVEERLLTPLGLRSLDPADPQYVGQYEGGVWQRDGAYHQGTVWAWLLEPFVDAWVRTQGTSTATRREARRRFVQPLERHLDTAGLGHVSEIADGDPPHTPRGCPFQAWSLGALIRMKRIVCGDV